MKVRHFKLHLDPKYGGPTASVPAQCIGARKLGDDVSLVTFDDSRPFEGKLIEAGVDIIHIKAPSVGRLSRLGIQLRKFLSQDTDVDIYHSHGVWVPSVHWIASAARKHGIKYVVNPRGDLELYRINYNFIKKMKKMLVWAMYAKKDMQNASCIIATSQQEADAIRHLGISSPIAIIPNGIDFSQFPTEIDHQSHERKVLLFLSRVNPIKGIELLLEAWAKLPEDVRSGWELQIVGNSDPEGYVDSLVEMAEKLNVCESVSFIGPLKGQAKIDKYMSSDLFILPTYNENFGNVVAEALMCEVPAITTKNTPWSGLESEGCGWWIDLSVDNIISTLNEAMSITDAERFELGKKGRRFVIENYSTDEVAKKTNLVYEWLLGKSEKPDYVI